MEWVHGLGDAKIISVERANHDLTLRLDCSYTHLHSANYIEQIKFLNYQIKEDTDLAGFFWYQDQFKQIGDIYELHLKLCDGKGHKKPFVIQFSDFKIVHQS